MVRALVALLFVCNSKGSLSGSMTTMMTVPSFSSEFAFVFVSEGEEFASFCSSSSLGLKKINAFPIGFGSVLKEEEPWKRECRKTVEVRSLSIIYIVYNTSREKERDSCCFANVFWLEGIREDSVIQWEQMIHLIHISDHIHNIWLFTPTLFNIHKCIIFSSSTSIQPYKT